MSKRRRLGRCRTVQLLLLFGRFFTPVILSGCTAPFVRFPEHITPPRTVAILPLDNQTNSVPGAIAVRTALHRNLDRKGYVALALFQIDQLLANQFGISLGGQITEDLIPAIGKVLEADAVMTGAVLAYGGRVEIILTLYEARTGNRLWGDRLSGTQRVEWQRMPDGRMIAVPHHPFEELFAGLFAKMPNGPEPPRKSLLTY